MPNYKGHIVGGVLSYAALFYLVRVSYNPTYFTAFEWLIFALVGSLFPDIDIKSKGQNLFYQVIGVILLVLLVQRRFQVALCVAVTALLPLIVRHRGITHSFWFIVGLSFGAIVYVHTVIPGYADIIFFDTLFFFAGACSHILLDRVIS